MDLGWKKATVHDTLRANAVWHATKTSKICISVNNWPTGVGFAPMEPLRDGLHFGLLPVNFGPLLKKLK
jgi:hypothetical protein